MKTLYNHSDSNRRKTWFLMTGFFIFVIIVGYVFSIYMGNLVILYLAVGISIFSSFFSYWFSDKVILKMSDAKELKFEDNKEVYRLVENLCITAGLPLPKIYIINDPALNAFATGRDPKHAVIALTTGIIAKLEKNELEGVIAHELSHIGNRDIFLSMIVTVLVGMVVILADIFMRWSIFGGRRNNDRSGDNKMGIVIAVLAIVFAILAPLVASLMKLAISRKREFSADADGALLTRYPEGLIRALEKISHDPNQLRKANKATAHMFIASPFKGKQKKFLAKAFMTHPPVEERIKALKGL